MVEVVQGNGLFSFEVLTEGYQALLKRLSKHHGVWKEGHYFYTCPTAEKPPCNRSASEERRHQVGIIGKHRRERFDELSGIGAVAALDAQRHRVKTDFHIGEIK